ncbi:MAG: DNRLRE domain-containing protein [bacterium]
MKNFLPPPHLVAFLIVCLVLPMFTQAQETYPKPVSEYVEQTGPGTMVFLSYPKYFKDTAGNLAPVVTDLVPSSDPEWDYEVTKGIWQLKVKKDGTFQASHAGDTFTYRFNSLGFGRGSQFRAVNLGEPNFGNVSVVGDTIRWSNVFPDIDLSLRYIHDIMKVDVIVKKEFMRDLRAEVQAGNLNREDFLTAKFDIPSVIVTSQARQNGQPADLYAERLNINQRPLEFVKEEKVVHKLRPVETYVLDENGEPIYPDEIRGIKPIRSEQVWQLRQGRAGVAEMSANIGDLADAPDGDVVIDPSLKFSASTVATMDARLVVISGATYDLGASTELPLYSGVNDRLIFACDVSSLGTDKAVVSATLKLYSSANTTTSNAQIGAYNINSTWGESCVDWYEKTCGSNWTTAGGDYTTSNSAVTTITAGQSQVFHSIDLTAPFKARYPSGMSDITGKGFLLKLENSPGGYINFKSKEADVSQRWEMVITYFPAPGRTQETWHQPFLKKRDGNKNNSYDRWFPIGWYMQVNNVSALEDLSNHSSAHLYNAIVPIPLVDTRPRSQNLTYHGSTTVNQYGDMVDKTVEILNDVNRGYDYKIIFSITHGIEDAELMTPNRWMHIASGATYYPLSFSWANEIQKATEVATHTKIQNSAQVQGWFLADEPYGGVRANEDERDEIRGELDYFKSYIVNEDQSQK